MQLKRRNRITQKDIGEGVKRVNMSLPIQYYRKLQEMAIARRLPQTGTLAILFVCEAIDREYKTTELPGQTNFFDGNKKGMKSGY